MDKPNIIISPSGRLYGSENVLLDFLEGSKYKYELYVPKNSKFHLKLKQKNIQVSGFSSLNWLYFKIFFKLLFSKKNLYLNEGGHISYIKVIANFLPFRKFLVSIRLLEDCNDKLKQIPSNITLIPVSNFLKNKIITNARVNVILDPYALRKEDRIDNSSFVKGRFVIGIVGRLSPSKGIENLIPIIKSVEKKKRGNLHIKFFGTYGPTDPWFKKFKQDLEAIENICYSLEGFVNDQKEIYSSMDLLIHLNRKESLGRIIFEAVNYNTPFLLFNSGGAGELANLLGFKNFTIDDIPGWETVFRKKILARVNNQESSFKEMETAKNIIKQHFTPEDYAMKLEAQFRK